MKKFKGSSVYGGIAIGFISIYKKSSEIVINRSNIDNVKLEITRFEVAKEKTVKQLIELYNKALQDVGETSAMIFKAHQMILEDEEFLESIRYIISNQQVNSEYAVASTCDHFANMFLAMDDDYMKDRALDIHDMKERILQNLIDKSQKRKQFDEPVILFAQDLTPSETVSFEKNQVLAFVTKQGSVNSHTAILARTMDIPAIIQADIEVLDEYNGKLAIVDGYTSEIFIDPDEETLRIKREKLSQKKYEKEKLHYLEGMKDVTLDEKEVKLYANIGSIHDIDKVLKNDAKGIGLFRSEFLYLESSDFPTEEEQFKVYKKVTETMGKKNVIIRTLDIGADKQVNYFGLEQEENPQLGYRAIRICLTQKDLFKTQLRALYQASVYGNLSIMFPMIISVDEVIEIKKIVNEVKEELKQKKIPFKDVELGIMIETPAAALISDDLAKEVDFFSIGTNDLTQYTLAIDRQNEKLDHFFNAHHKAVLRLIELVIKNGHDNGIWVGICGELAGDLKLTETFLKMGVDELSVSPSLVLKVRKRIRESYAK